MAGRDRQAEREHLLRPHLVAVLDRRPQRRLLGDREIGHQLEGRRREPTALVARARLRLPGEEERPQPLVIGELGRPREGASGPWIAEHHPDTPALVVGPGEVRRAPEELTELGRGRPRLTVAPQRLSEAKAGERRVGIEIEVTPEEPPQGRRQELAVFIEDLLAELAVVAVEHRDLAEEREHHPLDRRRVGRPRSVVFDEDHVSPLGVRISGEHQEVGPALADHPIVVADPTLGPGGRGRWPLLGEGEDQSLGIGEIHPVPAPPEQGRALVDRRRLQGPRRRRRPGAMEPLGRVTQPIFDAIEGRLDLATGARRE